MDLVLNMPGLRDLACFYNLQFPQFHGSCAKGMPVAGALEQTDQLSLLSGNKAMYNEPIPTDEDLPNPGR